MPAGLTPEDELGTRLSAALHAELGAPVDVPELLDGSQRRARQVRNRRIGLGTAGVVLVVALPLGVEVVRGQHDPPPSAVISHTPGQPGPRRTSTVSPEPSPRTGAYPSVISSIGATGAGGAAITDLVSLTANELPAGLTLQADRESVRLPLVSGSDCSNTAPAATPVAGRQWVWAPSAPAAGPRVTLTVTGWSGSGAATAFGHLTQGTGRCAFSPPLAQEAQVLASLGADGWVYHSGPYDDRIVLRSGNLIAGIEVQDPAGRPAAIELAGRLGLTTLRRLTPPAPS